MGNCSYKNPPSVILLTSLLLLQVKDIHFFGCKYTDPKELIGHLQTKIGAVFNEKHIEEDIKALYRMGVFEDIKVFLKKEDKEASVIFHVKEQPYIKNVLFLEHLPLKEEELRKHLDIKEGLLNIHHLRRGKEKIAKLYREKGYFSPKIMHWIEEDSLYIKIDKGKRLFVKEVDFSPSMFSLLPLDWQIAFFPKYTTDAYLKKMIKTREGEPFLEEVAEEDVERILSAYWDRGYIQALCNYKMSVDEEGIDVFFNIKEGERFRIGGIDFSGNRFFDDSTLHKLMKIKEGEYYSHKDFLDAERRIYAHYGKAGFIEMKMDVSSYIKGEELYIHINIDEGERCFVEEIAVSGNKKTEESVIRKNMLIKEGEVLDIEKVWKTRTKLLQLGFFSEVDVQLKEGKNQGKKVCFNLKERRTGSLNVGFGYSSKYKLFGTLSVSELNLFGKGIFIEGKAEYGKRRLDYSFTLLHPYIKKGFEAGFSLRNTKYRREYYTVHTRGGEIRVGKEIGAFNKISLSYERERVNFPHIEKEEFEEELKRKEGLTSSITLSFSRDKRDEAIFPKKGYKLNATTEFAGGMLGGDMDFVKKEVELCRYIPSFAEHAIAARIKGGAISPGARDDYKYYLGGQDSVRGYDEEAIFVKKEGRIKGGNVFFLFNIEHRFFIKEGFYLLLFFDAGNVSEKVSNLFSSIYSSCGVGARIETPMGLLKFDWGYPFRKEGARLHFGFGPSF